tara:strand:- start:944 stop:1627 length:684 start_codon:yes stop_codon:yes gene_type:complete
MSTLKTLREDIQADLDLEDEVFISDADINRWINQGIRSAERIIHGLYEDYFLSNTDTSITTASNLVSYPSDIFANKIRKIIFKNSSKEVQEVRRVTNLVAATDRDVNETGANPTLEWSPTNDSVNGKKIRLFPSASRDGTLSIWYIRNALQLSADDSECDIDEFEVYVKQYTKVQCYLKEGDPRADSAKALEQQYKVEMIEVLTNMSPDNNDEIPLDMSFYDDSIGE